LPILGSATAHAVRGPRYSESKGSTPVLASEEATELLRGMDISTPIGLRDHAIVAAMTTPSRGSVRSWRSRSRITICRKNGGGSSSARKTPSSTKCPATTTWGEYLDAYIQAAGICDDRKGPLFRAASRMTNELSDGPMSRVDVWRMVRRRADDAGIETAIGCHTFRATGITDYLKNGGRIEVAQRMAGHSNAKTTGLYDRRNDDVSLDEVERIGI
jgi:site-specific recombinase XerD